MERQYIGARYVPKFADPIEWNDQTSYEALTIVTYMGASYTSKKAVPAGVRPTDNAYWAITGNYNAQVESYRQEVTEVKKTITGVKGYGAVGDGITDDTVAIQNAINSGYAYFPEGTYLFGGVTFPATPVKVECDANAVFIAKENGQTFFNINNGFSAERNIIDGCTFNGNGHSGVTAFKMTNVGAHNISNTHFINIEQGFVVDGSKNLTIRNTTQIGDCFNTFTSSRLTSHVYNWNTIVDGWVIYEQGNENNIYRGLFTLTGMVNSVFSKIVTMGQLRCIAFDIIGMSEGVFISDSVIVVPSFGIRAISSGGVSPSCIQLSNVSFDQYSDAAIFAKDVFWLMCSNCAFVNGVQRDAINAAVIVSDNCDSVFFENCISYNNSFAAFNIGKAKNCFLSNCRAYATNVGAVYACPYQTPNNPKISNCSFESTNMGQYKMGGNGAISNTLSCEPVTTRTVTANSEIMLYGFESTEFVNGVDTMELCTTVKPANSITIYINANENIKTIEISGTTFIKIKGHKVSDGWRYVITVTGGTTIVEEYTSNLTPAWFISARAGTDTSVTLYDSSVTWM